MKRSSGKLRKGAILSYLSIGINIAAGLIYTPWMIKQIGQSQYGIYTLAISLISLLMFDFGLSSAAGKYISNYHAVGDEEGVNRVLGLVYKLYLIIDAVIFFVLLVLLFFLESIYVKLSLAEIAQLKIAYIIVGVYSLISFPCVTLNGVLVAYEKFSFIKLADIIYRCIIIILMVGFLSLGYGLYALVTVNAVAGLLTILFKYVVVRNTTAIKVKFAKTDVGQLKEMLCFSFWITIHSLAQRLIFNITPTILGTVSDSKAIAVFGIVTTVESYTYLIATAINGMFMPKVSRIVQGVDEDKSITPLLLRVGRYQYAINCAIVVGFICLGRDFIMLWMGEAYIDAYIGISLVIVPGVFFNALQVAHTSMIVQNKAKPLALVNMAMGIVNIVASIILSQRYGVIGACVSICIAYIIRNLLTFAIYPKNINADFKLFGRECFLKSLPATVICLCCGFAINRSLAGDTWLRFIIKCILLGSIILFSIIIHYLIIRREERKNAEV